LRPLGRSEKSVNVPFPDSCVLLRGQGRFVHLKPTKDRLVTPEPERRLRRHIARAPPVSRQWLWNQFYSSEATEVQTVHYVYSGIRPIGKARLEVTPDHQTGRQNGHMNGDVLDAVTHRLGY